MSDSLLMAELLEEICQRLEAGESVDMHLYAAKHPELASQLQQLVPAMTVLGELSQSSADTANKSQDSATPNYPPLGDYRLVGQIGRGGMGVVYPGRALRRGKPRQLRLASSLAASRCRGFVSSPAGESQCAICSSFRSRR